MRQRRIVTQSRIHTSRLREDRGLFLSLTNPFKRDEAHLRSPLRSSLSRLLRNWRVVRVECCGRCSWPILCMVSGIDSQRQRASVPARMCMRPRPSTLQTIAVVERQFSRTFPAHPRSLASVLIPRPAALRLLLFPDSSPNQMRWVPTPENASSALGSGAHSHPTTHRSCVGDPGISRRFAQECPEGNTGKSNKEN
jgi:hypothetical protein